MNTNSTKGAGGLSPPIFIEAMSKITISPEHYTGKDIDIISDIICEILAEHHDVVVDAISFDIEVTYTTVADEDE